MTTAADLRRYDALRSYNDADVEVLARYAPLRAFAPGAPLFQQGAVPESCFLMLHGEVDVVRAAREKVRVLATLRPPAMVGQLALVDRAPRSASVVASTEVHALEIGRELFEKLVQACSPLALRFQEQIAVAGIRQLRMATERLAALMDQRASEQAYLHVQGALEEWDVSLDDAPLQTIELAVDIRRR
jgi:CRP-like cAMP-binding protein